MNATRCDNCGGRFNRPGLHGCDETSHVGPDIAQQIVAIVEHELSDRRGLSWDSIEDETAYEIRDALASSIRKLLNIKGEIHRVRGST